MAKLQLERVFTRAEASQDKDAPQRLSGEDNSQIYIEFDDFLR